MTAPALPYSHDEHRRLRSADGDSTQSSWPELRYHPYGRTILSADSSPMALSPIAPRDVVSASVSISGSDSPSPPQESHREQSSAATVFEQPRGGRLPRGVTQRLRSWLLDHVDHPYPTDQDKRLMCQDTGLTLRQVSMWVSSSPLTALLPSPRKLIPLSSSVHQC